MAGDADLGERFIELVDPLRYPAEGLGEDAVREIRRLKARMESERLPRGADPTLHAKLGRGGLSDVEWTVQLLQMRHGWAEPGLRTTRTREALAAAHAAGLIPTEEAQTLDEAWVLATRVRNAVMLVRGRPGDTFPSEPRELAAVARYLGYESGHVGEMVDDYRRITRRARAVVEELFYGVTPPAGLTPRPAAPARAPGTPPGPVRRTGPRCPLPSPPGRGPGGGGRLVGQFPHRFGGGHVEGRAEHEVLQGDDHRHDVRQGETRVEQAPDGPFVLAEDPGRAHRRGGEERDRARMGGERGPVGAGPGGEGRVPRFLVEDPALDGGGHRSRSSSTIPPARRRGGRRTPSAPRAASRPAGR